VQTQKAKDKRRRQEESTHTTHAHTYKFNKYKDHCIMYGQKKNTSISHI
jgi:hypothetical protein